MNRAITNTVTSPTHTIAPPVKRERETTNKDNDYFVKNLPIDANSVILFSSTPDFSVVRVCEVCMKFQIHIY